MNLFKLIAWAVSPEKAVNYANSLFEEIKNNNKDRLKKAKDIAYINEFFSKYAVLGKPHEEVLLINKKVDQKQKTNDKLINTLIELRKIRSKTKEIINAEEITFNENKRIGVSPGVAFGKILNIKNTNQKIPSDIIGIFPSQEVKYTNLFKKCAGIIFMKGGMTSHGAIIAREFNIPAIISPNIKIADNTYVTIDGNSGNFTKKER